MGEPIGVSRLRLDVEGMKHSILTAIADYQGDLQREVERMTAEYLGSEGWRRDVAEAVRTTAQSEMRAAVEQAVRRCVREALAESEWLQGAVQRAVRQEIGRLGDG